MSGIGVPEERWLFGELTVDENLHHSKISQNTCYPVTTRQGNGRGRHASFGNSGALSGVGKERAQKSSTLSRGTTKVVDYPEASVAKQ